MKRGQGMFSNVGAETEKVCFAAAAAALSSSSSSLRVPAFGVCWRSTDGEWKSKETAAGARDVWAFCLLTRKIYDPWIFSISFSIIFLSGEQLIPFPTPACAGRKRTYLPGADATSNIQTTTTTTTTTTTATTTIKKNNNTKSENKGKTKPK